MMYAAIECITALPQIGKSVNNSPTQGETDTYEQVEESAHVHTSSDMKKSQEGLYENWSLLNLYFLKFVSAVVLDISDVLNSILVMTTYSPSYSFNQLLPHLYLWSWYIGLLTIMSPT